ncbi:MAG: site-specific integrase [Thermoplasmata archaeon]|nr:site-specific integrase [Thermoplasmata archaeon]
MTYKHKDPTKQKTREHFNRQTEEPEFIKAFQTSQKINDFLTDDIEAQGTRKAYTRALKGFFREQKIYNIDEYIKNPETLENGDKITYKDELERHIKKHKTYVSDTLQYEGNTIHLTLSAVRSFLETNKIELGNKFWRDFEKRGKGTRAVTDTKTPDIKTLREILNQGDTETKAAFLIQMNNGARIDQIPTLEWSNIQELNNEFPMIVYHPDQNKTKRLIKTFITPETKELLLQYRNQREAIIKARKGRKGQRDHLRKNELDENKIFPMTTNNLQKKWRTMCVKAGHYVPDDRTNRPAYGSHCLRRYFLDNFGDRDLAKLFCGKTTRNEEAYFRKPDNELRKIYAEHADKITILKETSENTIKTNALRDELEQWKQKYNNLEAKHKGESDVLRDRFTQQDKKLDRLSRTIDMLAYRETIPVPPKDLDPTIFDSEALKIFDERVEQEIQRKRNRLKEQIRNNPDVEIIDIDGVPYLKRKTKTPKEESFLKALDLLSLIHEKKDTIDKNSKSKQKDLKKELDKLEQQTKRLLLDDLSKHLTDKLPNKGPILTNDEIKIIEQELGRPLTTEEKKSLTIQPTAKKF